MRSQNFIALNSKLISFLKSSDWKNPWVFSGMILIFLGIVTYFGVAVVLISENVSLTGGKTDWNLTSQVGTFIGGIVTPLWTLVGAFFIYRTLRLQFEAFQTQKAQIATQQFESILFKMMERQFAIKTETEFGRNEIFVRLEDAQPLPAENQYVKGEPFFFLAKSNFDTWFRIFNWKVSDPAGVKFNDHVPFSPANELARTPDYSKIHERLVSKAQRFYSYYNSYFENYFFHLETLLALIEREEAKHRKKINIEENVDFSFYIQMIKAQFTISELYHLFYGSYYYTTIQVHLKANDILEKLTETDLVDIEHAALLDTLKRKK